MIVAAAAVFVGICALGVSLYQASIMRAQQEELSIQRRAEAWPHLEFGKGYNTRGFQFVLFNQGIGPAKIESIQLTMDDKPYTSWDALFLQLLPDSSLSGLQSHMGGRVLPPNKKIDAYIAREPLASALENAISRIRINFCYCSVYDECWLYEETFKGESERVPVEACTPFLDEFKQ